MEFLRIRFGKNGGNERDIIHYAKKVEVEKRKISLEDGTSDVSRDEWEKECPTLVVGKDSSAMRIAEVEKLIPICQNGESPLYSIVIPAECQNLIDHLLEKYDDHSHLQRAIT